MIAIAHFLAISAYLGAAALAAVPFARPVKAPITGVLVALSIGLVAHAAALASFTITAGAVPFTGLGPALSFAGFLLAATLTLAEFLAREVSLTVIAAPLAAVPTLCANIIGLAPGRTEEGFRGVWLFAHIALSFAGIAAFATAAAAGIMYLAEHRELKSRRFGAVFRFFPPLETLDRVNHNAAITGWLGLTLGLVLAGSYSFASRELNVPQLVWGTGAWVLVSLLALGRMVRGWQARRAAVYASIAFATVVILYVAFRVAGPSAGQFL
jgi:HemX protein